VLKFERRGELRWGFEMLRPKVSARKRAPKKHAREACPLHHHGDEK